jgi:hypothetical protein
MCSKFDAHLCHTIIGNITYLVVSWPSAGSRTADWKVVSEHTCLEVSLSPGAGGPQPV